ncbi:sugar transferase [Candidatus Azambacteria bacterium]|nr:sugar transferase [Candidatus Azambacteria bacterium]
MLTKAKKIILIFGDLLILYISLYLTLLLRYGSSFDSFIWQDHFLPFTIVYTVWIFIFYLAGLYNQNIAKNNYKFYSILLKAVAVGAFAAIGIFYLTTSFLISPKTNLAIDIGIFLILFALWRQAYNRIIRSSALTNRILFIGENAEVNSMIKILNENPQLGYKILGVLSGSEENIKNIIEKEKVNVVVHAKDAKSEQNLAGLLYSLLPLGITVYDLPKFYSEITRKIPVSIIGRTWFLENLLEVEKGIYEITKRGSDILFAFILGIITLPFFPFIIIAINLNSKGGAFYTQTRVGKNGKIFKLLKFRTMVEDAEKQGAQWTKENDSRITKIGNILRKTRIDELPQLWNVIKGDISFIGPRPERPEFVATLEKEIPHYQIRHLVRPGLTGWAQINQPLGSASVKDSTEKLQYDLYYIKNRSLVLDLDILAKTIMVVLKREGH